ncbi:MAG: SIS domain-containing protein [Thermoprotei archaeon]
MDEFQRLEEYVCRSYGSLLSELPRLEVKACNPEYFVVAGLGGSGIVGRLLEAACAKKWGRPFVFIDGSEDTLVLNGNYVLLAVSFSGNTIETLRAYSQHRAGAAAAAVVSNGGELVKIAERTGDSILLAGEAPAPRFGLPSMLEKAVLFFARSTGAEWVLDEFRVAVKEGPWSKPSELVHSSKKLVTETGRAVPVFYGAEHTKWAAYRWKTQVNENAKSPAFHSILPEANHNEVNGWVSAPDNADIRPFVMTSDVYSKLTKAAISAYKKASGKRCVDIALSSETALGQIIEACCLGDVYSLELAKARGANPSDISVLESAKKETNRILSEQKSGEH